MINLWWRTPVLTRGRIAIAVTTALLADLIQIGLGPLGWTFADEIIDVIAMIIISRALGFHPLLLPTFLLEFLPMVDMLPTWTACVTAVIVIKRRIGSESSPGPEPAPIDAEVISAERVDESRPVGRQPPLIEGGAKTDFR